MKFIASSMLVLGFLSLPAMANDYPVRPIKMIIPFAAGGGGDLHGRILAEKMSEFLKQPIVIDNRAGANGNIAYGVTAKSPADGYTIALVGANIAMAPFIYKSLQYNATTDLSSVSLVAKMQNAFVVNGDSPIKSMNDLIAAANAHPGKINYASSGLGGSPHLVMEMLQNSTGTKITHIPYKGDQDALPALMGGQVDVYAASLAGVVSMIDSGKLRALAVTGKNRSPVLPKIPTAAEEGVRDFDLESWWSIMVPATTDPQIVEKLNAAIKYAVQNRDVKAKFLKLGSEAAYSTPEGMNQILRKDLNKYENVIKLANIQPM